MHLAGLLHDVGKLVLPVAFGEAQLEQVAAEAPRGARRAALERERLGVDHAYGGALLAEASGLPEVLADAIACITAAAPAQDPRPPRPPACSVANAIAGMLAAMPPTTS